MGGKHSVVTGNSERDIKIKVRNWYEDALDCCMLPKMVKTDFPDGFDFDKAGLKFSHLSNGSVAVFKMEEIAVILADSYKKHFITEEQKKDRYCSFVAAHT